MTIPDGATPATVSSSAGGSGSLLSGAHRGGGGSNVVLTQTLRELGWSHVRLVTVIEAVLGRGYVGRSTVSEWVNQARVPREPLPTIVAHLLSEATGRRIGVGELWGGRATASPVWRASLDGVADTELGGDVDDLIADWLADSEPAIDADPRVFLATWGTRLTDHAWSYIDNPITGSSAVGAYGAGGRDHAVSAPMVAIYSGVVARLRRFDDREGGSVANTVFVRRFLATVGHQLRAGEADSAEVGSQLLRVWMQLSQIAGWMAYDSEQHGLAQRYFVSTLRAARALGDAAFGAHALAHLTHQAMYLGKKREAIELANAAVEAAKGAPHAQRALVTALLAHTEALAGNAHGCEAAMDRARALLSHPAAVQTKPDWLYWFDSDECAAKRGHALLALSVASSRPAAGWLAEATRLLGPKTALDDAFPREAVYNRLWLARGHIWNGDAEQALRLAAPTLAAGVVRSPRSVALLRAFDADLAARPPLRRLPAVAALRAELAAVVSGRGSA